MHALTEDVARLNDAHMEREEVNVIRLGELEEVVSRAKTAAAARVAYARAVDLHGELLLSLHWSILAYTGLVKILKKHHKRTGLLVRAPHLADMLNQPFCSVEMTRDMVLRVEAIVAELAGRLKIPSPESTHQGEALLPDEREGGGEVSGRTPAARPDDQAEVSTGPQAHGTAKGAPPPQAAGPARAPAEVATATATAVARAPAPAPAPAPSLPVSLPRQADDVVSSPSCGTTTSADSSMGGVSALAAAADAARAARARARALGAEGGATTAAGDADADADAARQPAPRAAAEAETREQERERAARATSVASASASASASAAGPGAAPAAAQASPASAQTGSRPSLSSAASRAASASAASPSGAPGDGGCAGAAGVGAAAGARLGAGAASAASTPTSAAAPAGPFGPGKKRDRDAAAAEGERAADDAAAPLDGSVPAPGSSPPAAFKRRRGDGPEDGAGEDGRAPSAGPAGAASARPVSSDEEEEEEEEEAEALRALTSSDVMRRTRAALGIWKQLRATAATPSTVAPQGDRGQAWQAASNLTRASAA